MEVASIRIEGAIAIAIAIPMPYELLSFDVGVGVSTVYLESSTILIWFPPFRTTFLFPLLTHP